MTDFEMAVSAAELEARKDGVLSVPLHRFLGIEVLQLEPGRCLLRLPAGEPASNNVGVVHGGVLYALLDVCCYLAAAPLFAAGENIVSHDVHVSVMRPAASDADIDFEGRVLRMGRSLVFGEGVARAAGKLIARATVTKSRVKMPDS